MRRCAEGWRSRGGCTHEAKPPGHNPLSYYLKGQPKVVEAATEYLAAFGRLDFTAISYYEVRRGLRHAGATRVLSDFESLADMSNVWDLDRWSAGEAADICAKLWRAGQPLDDADILIAGIARAHGLVLVTNNVQHFGRIEGLEIENWMQ